MIAGRVTAALALTVGLLAGSASLARAQEASDPKDDALDSLLRKLEKTPDNTPQGGAKADKSDRPDAKPTPSDGPGEKKQEAKSGAKAGDRPGRPATAPTPGESKDGKASGTKADGAAKLDEKDQEVDDLLEKLGETKETPAKDDRPRGGGDGDQKPEGGQPPAKPGKRDRDHVAPTDKPIDERLEELTGRTKRKKQDDGERTGAVGEMIKEMRDVEQKLGKPDTGEGTRQEQKQIVKRIDTMIEEVRRSGSSSMRQMVVRRIRQAGQRPGQQQGNTAGAMAQGARLMKPARPTNKQSTAGGRQAWGHLPAELQQEVDNMFTEQSLTAKQELIERYYLSIAKRKLVREE